MRSVVLFQALVVLVLGAVSCLATSRDAGLPVPGSPTRVLATAPPASPTSTRVVTPTSTETPTPTPSSTPQPTHTPTLSPTPSPTSRPAPLSPTATAARSSGYDCPPDGGCLRVVNQSAEPLTCRFSGGGGEREISVAGDSDGTTHLPPGQYAYRAMTEVSACDTGPGRDKKRCRRIGLDAAGVVRADAGKTSQLVFAVTCHEWDAGDCMAPELVLLEAIEPAPTATVPGSPTPTATATPVCECPPNMACLTVVNHIGDLLIVEIVGSDIAQVMEIDPNSQGGFALPAGPYEYTAHAHTGYRLWCFYAPCDAYPAEPVYIRGNVDIEPGLCHRLAIAVSCGWWDEGRCLDPELVLAE